MDDQAKAIVALVGFVEGGTDTRAFEEVLYRDSALEAVLSLEPAPRHSPHGTTLFQHLIALDYGDVADVVDARGLLACFLEGRGMKVVASDEAREKLRLLHSSQPRWLDADTAFLSKLLATAPAGHDTGVWLKQRIRELFRFAKRPPRWLQAPRWPMGKEGPMVFLGQVAVDDYFHDSAAVYVFHDPVTGECRSIIQTL